MNEPRAHHRHSRGHIRHHRQRVIKNRVRDAQLVTPKRAVTSAGLANHSAFGCRKKGCLICHFEKVFQIEPPKYATPPPRLVDAVRAWEEQKWQQWCDEVFCHLPEV